MHGCLSRRGFLRATAALSAAAVASPTWAGAAKLPVGCRDRDLKWVARPDVWAAMKTVGAECVEVVVNDDLGLPFLFHAKKKYTLATPASIAELAADMKAAGLRITAFCMSNHFDERPEMEVEWCAKVAAAAATLGVPAVRLDVVVRKPAIKDFLGFSIDVLKKVVAASASTAIRFGIENHGRTTNDPEFMGALLDGVGSPRMGVTLDTANLYWFGHPLAKLYDIYARFAPRVVHTHCKSIRYPAEERNRQRKMGWEYAKYNAPVYEGDIDFARVARILKDAGYANDLCIENESLGKFPEAQRGEVLAKELAHLKTVA